MLSTVLSTWCNSVSSQPSRAAVAPDNKTTLSALKDLTKRPPSPREAVPDHIRHFSPDEEFDLDVDLFLKNKRTARRGNIVGTKQGPCGNYEFAAAHDCGVWRCLCKILSILPSCGAEDQARLPLWEGGLGLRSAQRTQPAAHWASWADAIKMVKDRHPSVVELIVSALEGGREVRSIQVVTQRTGFDCPPWAHLVEGRTPGVAEEEEDPCQPHTGWQEEDPCQPHTGWQQQAASSIERHHLKNAVWPVLQNHGRDTMRSLCGLGTLSSKLQKKKSSKNTFIQKHFHLKTLSSTTISSKTEDSFIQQLFHPRHFHPKNGFIQ